MSRQNPFPQGKTFFLKAKLSFSRQNKKGCFALRKKFCLGKESFALRKVLPPGKEFCLDICGPP